MGTRARLWDFSKFVPKKSWTATMASAWLSSFSWWHTDTGSFFVWSAEENLSSFAYIPAFHRRRMCICTPSPLPLIWPCHNLLSQPSGNQTDVRATVFHFNLRTALVTLPIPTSMTCTIACTFMFRVFQDRQALKSSEWAFVPVEFEIPYHYLQTRRFLWILDLTKR